MTNFDCEKIILTDKEEGVITKILYFIYKKRYIKRNEEIIIICLC